ncbi:MAG TPA: hypothetical protein VGX76_05070, partial [Pirellulales bacterium]|nr:hypothetical protein [Pirellulales bacterium]
MSCVFRQVEPGRFQCAKCRRFVNAVGLRADQLHFRCSLPEPPSCKHLGEPVREQEAVFLSLEGGYFLRASDLELVGTGPAERPCGHMGPAVREEACATCRGNVRIKVYACTVYGECQPKGKSLPDIQPCNGCEKYEPGQPVTRRPKPRVESPGGSIDVSFFHGLGDHVHFAHSLPLYTRRGHKVEVHCEETYRPLYEAAGVSVNAARAGASIHAFPHGPTGAPKPRWNLSHPPMPSIGEWEAANLWEEYQAVSLDTSGWITDAQRSQIADALAAMPRPIIALHAVGREPREGRSFSPTQTNELVRALLDRMPGTIL